MSEEAQRNLLLELDTIFTNASLGILYTRDRVFQRCNPRGAEILGYAQNELNGQPGLCIYPDQAAYEALGQAAGPKLAAGKPFSTEMQLRRKDGSLVWCQVFAKAVDPQNTQSGTLWIFDDITARHTDQELLKASIDKLEALMKNAPVPILFTRDRMMLQHNAQFGRIFGFEGDTAIGKPARILFRSDDEYAEVGRVAGPLLSQAKPFRMELFMYRQDGGDLWINLIGFVAYTQDPAQGTYWILEDRTEFKHAEEALRQSHALLEQRVIERTRELEAANTRLQDFADTASDWFWEMGPDLRFTYFSERMTEILGIAPEANLGKTRQEVMNPADIDEKWERHFADLEQHRPFRNFEYRIKVPGDGVCEISVSGKPIFNEAGIFLGYRGIGQDISERKEAERSIRDSESLFRNLFRTSPIPGSISTEADGLYFMANEAFTRIFGYRNEEIVGKTSLQIGLWPNPEARQAWVRHLAASDATTEYQAQIVDHAGQPHDVLLYACRLDYAGGPCLLTMLHDITERKRSEEGMRQAASVFEHANEGIIITDSAANILDVNAAFVRITDYGRDEVIGKNPRFLQSDRQGPEFYAAMWQTLAETGRWSGELWDRRKNGGIFAALLTISAVRDDAGRVSRYVALFSDITALKEHQKQLEHVAHHDALTGLPNRVLLADRLVQAIAQSLRRQTQVAVVYLDLDGFKEVNDLHGHGLGDRLLVELAARMKQALREGDTLARLGGDEFVAVLLDLDSREASKPILDRLLSAASEPVCFDELRLCVSASIGVSFFSQAENIDADQLLRQADQAMYQAKQSGKNRYHLFDAEHDRVLRGRHETIERIREGLERNEFVLFYQPKINLRSGKVVGAEALIRWQHPEQGLLSPVQFLPLIENDDLIILIGDWVIETALLQMDDWRSTGLDLPVSVNVAGRQLQSPGFLGKLKVALHQHPMAAGRLQLEVLESSALDDIAQVSQVIEACRGMGISFALDDFGTGYSSLTYLKRLPAQTLKIDQSFVRDMLEDPEDLAILDGIVGLAESFQREAIAEGVETAKHGEMLLKLGCELGQGYAIARPMPAVAVAGWVSGWLPTMLCAPQDRIGRDEMPVLFAMTEHRAWIKALGYYLEGKQLAPPPLDHHQCRFGQWLDRSGMRRYAEHPALEGILRLHEAIHQKATELLKPGMNGQTKDDVQAQFAGIEVMREALLAQLERLIDRNVR